MYVSRLEESLYNFRQGASVANYGHPLMCWPLKLATVWKLAVSWSASCLDLGSKHFLSVDGWTPQLQKWTDRRNFANGWNSKR